MFNMMQNKGATHHTYGWSGSDHLGGLKGREALKATQEGKHFPSKESSFYNQGHKSRAKNSCNQSRCRWSSSSPQAI